MELEREEVGEVKQGFSEFSEEGTVAAPKGVRVELAVFPQHYHKGEEHFGHSQVPKIDLFGVEKCVFIHFQSFHQLFPQSNPCDPILGLRFQHLFDELYHFIGGMGRRRICDILFLTFKILLDGFAIDESIWTEF